MTAIAAKKEIKLPNGEGKAGKNLNVKADLVRAGQIYQDTPTCLVLSVYNISSRTFSEHARLLTIINLSQ